jgi:hypothetical protein
MGRLNHDDAREYPSTANKPEDHVWTNRFDLCTSVALKLLTAGAICDSIIGENTNYI